MARLTATLLVPLMLVACGGQEQWGPFTGRVVDAETGAPIAGANVMVTWYERQPNPVQGQVSFLDAQEAVTDVDGRFTLPRLERSWTLAADPPGFRHFAPGYVVEGHEVTPPDGRRYVDPTVVKMHPLKTREERCLPQHYVGSPLHDKAPLFREAVEEYRRGLDC